MRGFRDKLMCKSSRFRQAESGGAGEDDCYGIIKSAFVSYRDEYRFDICAGSKDGPDYFIVVLQQSKVAFLRGWFFENTDEPAFCAADCGFIEKKAEVGGDTESARMGDALAVNDEHIGTGAEFFDGGDAGGRFAERQESGYVREGNLSDCDFSFNKLKIRQFQNDYRGNYFHAVFCKGTVKTSYEFGSILDRREQHFAGKSPL